MKYTKPSLILTCLLLFSLSNAVAQEVLAKLDGNTVTAVADSSTLESLLTEIFEVSEVPEVELEGLQFQVVANNIYLTSRGKTKEGNDVTIARLLNQKDGSLYQGSTAHACSWYTLSGVLLYRKRFYWRNRGVWLFGQLTRRSSKPYYR